MQYITVSQSFTAVLRIPESESTDTVTYTIRKASDGSVFATGAAAWVGSNHWKCTFTPAVVGETYVVEMADSEKENETAESFTAVQDQPVTTDESEATTASELLTKVNAAISSRLNGGGVNAYRLQDGRNLEYMSLDELRALRKELQREIAGESTQKQTVTHIRFNRPL